MSRLRVGDIEIDGSRITIGGNEMTAAAPAERRTQTAGLVPHTSTAPAPVPASVPAPVQEGLQTIARLPMRPRWWMGGGLAVASLGAVSLALAGSVDLATYLFHGGMLIPAGLGMMVVGALKRTGARAARAAAAAEEDARLGPVMERVRRLLDAPPERELTIEKITARLGLPEAEVVRALVRLRDRGEIREELNLETGEWFYLLALAGDEGPRDLDTRLAELEKRSKDR